MSEQLALLKSIISNREDDTPRLVYADWLQENGQEERTEFIKVQVALAKCGPEHKKSGFGPVPHILHPAGLNYWQYTMDTVDFENNYKTGDRVDVRYTHWDRQEKLDSTRVKRGLVVVRIEGGGGVTVKRDEYSGPWKGTELKKREKELIGNVAHNLGLKWWVSLSVVGEEVMFGSVKAKFTRGFISHITCTPEDWVSYSKELYWDRESDCPLTAQPIEKVTLIRSTENTFDMSGFGVLERCGAAGDGVTDDTVAIQAVIHGQGHTFRCQDWPGIEFELSLDLREPTHITGLGIVNG